MQNLSNCRLHEGIVLANVCFLIAVGMGTFPAKQQREPAPKHVACKSRADSVLNLSIVLVAHADV
jgi:hypothetical protein